MAAAAYATTSLGFVRWDEVFVSSDKGRREVHYYLKRRDGSSDLAVVGKERSLRHMSYHYAFRPRLPALQSIAKLKSRREVIDWLNSIVSDGSKEKSSPLNVGISEGEDACEMDIDSFKDMQSRKLGRFTKDFQWLGSPWSCRKKRRHYQSFQRNGVKIYVHDFVYVLAEEDKRLVAYLEDMYEDSKGNKMVVVRWYHKIDEVGIVLPHNFNDREIFFSLCLQDLSIECIDGLATVLSRQHFEKFQKEARHTHLEPFFCHKQFENDDVKSFDVTQVKGYWKQDILRYMYTLSPSKDSENSEQSIDDLMVEGYTNAIGIRPRKRQCTEKREVVSACGNVRNLSIGRFDFKSGNETWSLRGASDSTLPNKIARENLPQYFEVGSPVEVLSQDSGIRGCWFRASIIKKHKDKVKVRYEDIQDAADEAKKLEEWILSSKVASPDQLDLRIFGRTVVRPSPQSNNKTRGSWAVVVGTAVDVWRHDGWWEGIVVQKESDDRIHVFFPGEKQDSVFCRGELRHSQEWVDHGWTQIKERLDLVPAVLSALETNEVSGKSCHGNSAEVTNCAGKPLRKDESGSKDSSENSDSDKDGKVKDLSKDNLLSQLKWKSSKKRRRGSGGSVPKVHHIDAVMHGGAPDGIVSASRPRERFVISTSLKVDCENCKYIGDALFSSSVVPPLTSLVMSR